MIFRVIWYIVPYATLIHKLFMVEINSKKTTCFFVSKILWDGIEDDQFHHRGVYGIHDHHIYYLTVCEL